MDVHVKTARALVVLVFAAGLAVTPTAVAMASPAGVPTPVPAGDAPPPPPPPGGGMHYNDDVPLDPSQVTDARGCTDPDPNICNWSDEKYRQAKEAEGD